MIDETMESYGYDEHFARQAEPFLQKGLVPARITGVYRDLFKAVTTEGEVLARLKGAALRSMQVGEGYPAVGDFVMCERDATGTCLIHSILPRKSRFSRPKPGGHGEGSPSDEQLVAANFDFVFILMSLNQNFNLGRLERYLAAGWQSGGTPVVVLTKSDLCENDSLLPAAQKAAIGADVHAVSAVSGEGLEWLQRYLQKGKTIVLLGSSGVGKSTLLNKLAGCEIMATAGIRSDGAGRHTTTCRELILLPCGTCIIDTPGMRELGMWDTESGIDDVFAEIAQLARKCRFADCRHEKEPGCAVHAAIQSGRLEEKRYLNYLKLQKEVRFMQRKEERRTKVQQKREYPKTAPLEYE